MLILFRELWLNSLLGRNILELSLVDEVDGTDKVHVVLIDESGVLSELHQISRGEQMSQFIERLLILCDAEEIFDIKNSLDCYVINLNEDPDYALSIAEELRNNSFSCEMNYYKRSLKAQFKSSERKNARFVLIIGEDEVKEGTITLKDTLTKAQESVKRDELTDRLDQLMEDYYE